LPYIPPRPPTKAGRYVEKGKNEIKKEKEDSASSSFSSVEKKKMKKDFCFVILQSCVRVLVYAVGAAIS
jgi:hypothetical protein